MADSTTSGMHTAEDAEQADVGQELATTLMNILKENANILKENASMLRENANILRESASNNQELRETIRLLTETVLALHQGVDTRASTIPQIQRATTSNEQIDSERFIGGIKGLTSSEINEVRQAFDRLQPRQQAKLVARINAVHNTYTATRMGSLLTASWLTFNVVATIAVYTTSKFLDPSKLVRDMGYATLGCAAAMLIGTAVYLGYAIKIAKRTYMADIRLAISEIEPATQQQYAEQVSSLRGSSTSISEDTVETEVQEIDNAPEIIVPGDVTGTAITGSNIPLPDPGMPTTSK